MKKLPAYNPLLVSYHRAFKKELEKMLEDLPLCAGDRVLDIGCGDGFYSYSLAPLVAPDGEVVGVDLLPAYLKEARQRIHQSLYPKLIHFQKADARRLPFADESFDGVWCAQSLYSLPDTQQVMREMVRVTRRGGAVAVLEDDVLHQLLLPWTLSDELLLRNAEWKAFQADKGKSAERFYIARQLRHLFKDAGLKPQRRQTYASHREFPVGDLERKFLDAYLKDLRQRTIPYVPKKERARLSRLLTPGSKTYLVDQPHFSMTCLDHVLWGKKQ
jgi:ubiquinone/menaquinone biosynthesis C-methylase UbiE